MFAADAAAGADNDCFDFDVRSDYLWAFETLDQSSSSLNHLQSPM